MEVLDAACDDDCEFAALTATAADLSSNLASVECVGRAAPSG